MTALLSCDVFPRLDRTDPLATEDEDLIPDKFGPNWFNHSREKEESKDYGGLIREGEVDDQALSDALKGESDMDDSAMLELN